MPIYRSHVLICGGTDVPLVDLMSDGRFREELETRSQTEVLIVPTGCHACEMGPIVVFIRKGPTAG